MQPTGDGGVEWSRDQFEREIRKLPGVLAVGFAETDEVVIIEVQAGSNAGDELAREATRLAIERFEQPVAVEIVRWPDEPPRDAEARLRLVDVTNDPAAGELVVYLGKGDDRAIGHAPTAHGLLGVVEATVDAI